MDRVRRRPRLFGPPRHGVLSRATAALSVPLVLTLVPVAAAPAAGATGRSSSAGPASVVAAPTAANSALTLAAQSPWVPSGQPFDVRLRLPSNAIAPSRLGLSVAVYPCLSSLSGFDQSLSVNALGTPSTATRQAIPVASLPTTAGIVDLSLPVVVDDSVPVAGAPFTIDLSSTSGQCQAFPSGVFPVRIQLVDTTAGAVVGSIVTHLVYSPSTPPSQKLRVALVVPLQTALAAAPATAAELAIHPSAALEAPSAVVTAGLTGTVGALAKHQTVPVTLSVSGQALEALSAAREDSAIDQLSSLALDTADHQVLYAPFVPVDASALVNAGLASELSLQVARGAQVSAPVTHQAPAQAGTGLGTWVSSTGLDADTVAALQSAGFEQVVVPPTAVSQPPTDGSAAVPFTVSGAHGAQLAAVATSVDLTARFATTADDPVLAAHQLVAELAQIFFEKPNAVTPRGVVVVPPTGWSASPAFVDALLTALDGNPMLLPVTVRGLLAAVPPSTSCRTDCRLTGAPGAPSLPAGAVRAQRNRVNAFASAAGTSPPARSVGTQLSDLVLSGQSALLRPAQQVSVEAAAGRALDAQLQRVSIGGGQVTLTSQQGTLPVTITSSAPYPVQVTMTLNSDKLSFPSGTTQWVHPGVITLVPAPHTNVIDVPVHTRGSGLFPVDVVLRSPGGGLEIASGTIDVRSTAASVVGILLSAGAVLVLAAWWYRTSRRRRAARRAEESQETHPRVPAGVP